MEREIEGEADHVGGHTHTADVREVGGYASRSVKDLRAGGVLVI